MKSLSESRFHYEFTIHNAESLWIYYPFYVITVNTLSAWRFCYEFTICSANFLKLLWNHYDITMIHHLLRDFTRNSSFFRKFIVCFANSPWIHFFAKSLWTHYLLRDFTMITLSFSRVDFLFREFSMNSLSVSRFLFEFTFSFVTICLLWIYYEFFYHFR